MGNERLAFRASESIGKRLSFRSALAATLCAAVFDCSTVRICSRVPSMFCDIVFMVFFFSALLCVFCPSPFTTEKAVQPGGAWEESSEGNHAVIAPGEAAL